jgi:DNA polymerase III epsilon subunit-like protein
MTDSPFGRTSFCLVDIETTGFSPDMHDITEIAAIRVNERFEVIGEMSRLVRISGTVPWRITEITGICNTLLEKEGVPLAGALEEVWHFTDGLPSFAHKASFDRNFLNAFASRLALPFQYPLECSIPVFKRLLPGRRSYGLPVLAEALHVGGGGAHRALADCRVLLGCLRRVLGFCYLQEPIETAAAETVP